MNEEELLLFLGSALERSGAQQIASAVLKAAGLKLSSEEVAKRTYDIIEALRKEAVRRTKKED
jgi:hypothetical protein